MGVRDRLLAYYAEELPTRRDRPLGPERTARLTDFTTRCHSEGLGSVLEVGCGAGRDGVALSRSGLRYAGVDLSPVGVALCREEGLTAVVASATSLPFADASVDAAWTMSTLMHLEGDDLDVAVAELGRVVRPGGLLDVGLWGADTAQERTDEAGRFFQQRTDDEVVALLGTVGTVESLTVWDRFADGGHYQCARVRIAG
ncbi:class I SAM-dependent methyltransferase [Desertihabitans aurantiacus]|uniref:class I SAM-dependent methyltransferase n=1 Tax=Desertihabitans aurantiacus TaxID=2282477 RepID=UPI0013005FF4|nr:class I SAM-dependent methyltransferase [Desertihabitans aurantiacus]